MASHTLGHDTLIGHTISHYRIVEKIGAGGMGEVFRAHDQHLDRDVAIKVLPPRTLGDESARKRFRKEALALSKLNHPNIATIHDFDTQQGVDFLVMEYIPGTTLSEKLAARPLPEKEVVSLGTQLAEGLSAAHEHGVVHRDLKPGNLRLTNDGRLKILDFGLARLRLPATPTAPTESLSETHTIAGTLPYMAPEQLLGGEIDARTDIHAAGLVLYEMVTGRYAFAEVERSQLIGAILHRPPGPPTTLNLKVSPELEWIIRKCLEKEPENRYQSAKEVAIDLRRLLAPSPVKVAEVPVAARKLWKVLLPAALIVVAATLGGTLFFRSRHTTTRLTEKDTIVLSDFDNRTGDPVFDDTLKLGLSVQLEQSPFFDLLSERKFNQTLKLMGRPGGERSTPDVTQEVCQRTGSKAMLSGSIAALGTQYVIGLRAVNCNTGDVLAEAQEQASGKEAVLKALDSAAINLRSKLGESLRSVQNYATPVEEATTPSLEALKAYSLGRKMLYAEGETAALPFYKRALELDPKFAMAYAWAGDAYDSFNQIGRGAEYLRKAYELRDKVSERERFFIEANYYLVTTGELEKASQILELWRQTYPGDDLPYIQLGYISGLLGNSEQRPLDEFREALRIEPNFQWNYSNLAGTYMALDRLREAEAVFKEAQERKLETESMLSGRYDLAFLKGDASQMAQLVSAATGKLGAEDLLLAKQADTQGWHGKLKDAHELTRRAMNSALSNDAQEVAATYQAAAALRDVESGNREQARVEANTALKLGPNRWVRAMAALALARAGDTARAEKLASELDEAFPGDTQIHKYWIPTIGAAVALQRKDPNEAVELLKVASTIELAQVTQFTIALCPVYLRGEAYLMLHDGSWAAGEFRKFIDHRGVVMNFPWGALARLGLARAYAMQGDTTKAKAAYQDFLTLWKDADPDIPVLKEAKAEYAKLQ